MTLDELSDAVQESRELAGVFSAIADIIEQKILPTDWRHTLECEEEPDAAQSEGCEGGGD